MNIGIFGNTNNYSYLVALGLRNLGVNARLVVNRPELLHRPESVSPEFAAAYPDWIMDCSSIAEEDFVSESGSISNVLNFLSSDCRGAILNHVGPSLAHHLHIPTVALMTGSDVTYYADYKSAEARRSSWSDEFTRSVEGRLAQRRWLEFVSRQRDGISSAQAVSFGVPGLIPEADALLTSIGVVPAQRFFVYIANTIGLALAPIPNNRRLVIFNGARLNWKRPLPPGFSAQDDKGTDVLVKGFAKFISAGGQGELRLVSKGLHVLETKQLVRHLQLEDQVTWLEEMSLSAFHDEVRHADVVCDQFGTSFPGMAALDAMALGRPVLANWRLDIMAAHFPQKMPTCHAETPDQVGEWLEKLAVSQTMRRELAESARDFAETHLSPEANAGRCLQRLHLP